MTNVIRVATWAELHDRLYESSWKAPLGRFRSSFAYRGVGRIDYSLETSLARLGGAEELERHMLRNFRKYAQREAVPQDSVWNWLAVAQHHGLPTRMLDWTYSPYVALHFATERVETFDVRRRHLVRRLQPHEPAAARPAEAGARRRGLRRLHRRDARARRADAGGVRCPRAEPFVAFLEPPSLDERIINQFALFSLLSGPSTRFDTWLEVAPAGLAQDHRPGGAEVGDPRQARSGQHHRTGALPGSRRPQPMAQAVLHAEAEGGLRGLRAKGRRLVTVGDGHGAAVSEQRRRAVVSRSHTASDQPPA